MKHINVRYFYVTDKIENKELSIEYCATEEMTADFFTKPLQGSSFQRYRNLIQGINTLDLPGYHATAMKYLIEKKNKIAALTAINEPNIPARAQECVGKTMT